MPGLKLFTGNRLEALADELAELIHTPLSSPLEGEIIMVQSKGMERWLSMQIASRLGICANIRFPFPNRFIRELFGRISSSTDLPGELPGPAWDIPEIMSWTIMGLIPALIDPAGPESAAFREIRQYLADDDTGLKRRQLSEKIAELFDQYLTYRPELIFKWEEKPAHGLAADGTENDEAWQAALWRAVVRTCGGEHRAALGRTFLRKIGRLSGQISGQISGRPADFPERVTVFGISTLPPFHIRVLAAISRLTDVNLFLMNPCREYWADIVSGREMKRIVQRSPKKGGGATDPDSLHLTEGNSLLASTGLLGRNFFSSIYELECEERDLSIDPEADTLLCSIQSDILNMRDRGKGLAPKELPAADRSIQIHSCHNPMREVEVLQDVLLSLFQDDPALEPRDVLVMTPDIGTYASYIQAVFSVPAEDPRRLPFSIADRGFREESTLIESFLHLLDLNEGRFEAAQVLTFLEGPTVRSRFGLTEEDLESIQRWVRETGIRWGIDRDSRLEAGVPGFAENTWKAGLEKLLLGYAFAPVHEAGPDRYALFGEVLPFDRLEENDFPALGRFLDFTDRLFTAAGAMRESRSLEGWSDFLTRLAGDFLAEDPRWADDALQLRRVLGQLRELKKASGFQEEIPLASVKHYLKNAFEQAGFGSGFLAGGITFCAMVPMRSIPFKVICLIGMNDDAYPRQELPLGFDLLAQDPRPGDRSRRNDDRYLFLEALLSARDRLYISYLGQSAQDNATRPPSVLVSELLDYIEQGYRLRGGGGEDLRASIQTVHRLQGFHADYFKPERPQKLFSYSAENCEAARAARRGDRLVRPFVDSPLPEPPGPERGGAIGVGPNKAQLFEIPLEDLCGFFRNPARFFLTRRLRLFLEEPEGLPDEAEPFDLKGLERFEIEQILFEMGLDRELDRETDRELEGVDLSGALPVVKATGKLPAGGPGTVIYNELAASVGDFVRMLPPLTRSGTAACLEVDRVIGPFRLQGRIGGSGSDGHTWGIHAGGSCYYRYAAVKTTDRIRSWIYHLVHHLICGPARCEVFCRDDRFSYGPIDGAEAIVRGLLELYREGLSRPIPFLPRASLRYAEAMQKRRSPEEALTAAARDWYGSDFVRGEREDPYFSLAFRGADPLSPERRGEFARISLTILNPMLQAQL